jgi:hypothetical protein
VVYKVRSLKKPTLGAGCLSVLTIGFLWFIGVFGGNLRCVDEGQIYRSAQLSDGNLRSRWRTRFSAIWLGKEIVIC